jgi:nitrogen-specific signal transduction histidine kinase
MIDTVFEPYVHSAQDALVTGTLGLGLAVAKKLAEQMDCSLTYQRTNGYTLFVLDVPVASTAQLSTRATTASG